MKFTGIVTILLAAAATAMPTTAETAATAETAYIPQQESQDWKSCTNDLLADFRRGTPPVKASCNMWDCLHRQASRYHRGGGIATVSNALDPICIGGNIISGIPFIGSLFGGGGGSTDVSDEEQQSWRQCTVSLLRDFDNTTGNKAACNMWTCLLDNAGRYGRGGNLAALANLITPVCKVGSIIDWKA
ncbi:hypothetical protein NQ176_g8049 [Zarea fungicola]|uniref:Uncharacterized protein n=1 Tax=Zarea fungicola TaxID=93591 RepID=A0ACC1MV54_9HYPO|nr:hypothetical protein NQ176_g8049 [Lecanicillium fungicola]